MSWTLYRALKEMRLPYLKLEIDLVCTNLMHGFTSPFV